MFVLVLLFGCQEPFGTDRHDLVADRIAAVRLAGDATAPVADAALVPEGRLWSDAPAALGWAWVPATDDAVEEVATFDATGPHAVLPPAPAEAPRLALVATFPDGSERRAFLDPGGDAEAVALTGITAEAVPGLALADVDATALGIDARVDLATEAAASVEPGGFFRLRAERAAPDADPPLVRWMAQGGTFFELDRTTADWVAGDLVLDGEDVVTRAALDAGAYGVIALAVDRLGATDFVASDLLVGDNGPGVRVGGRWVPGIAAEPGLYAVRFDADDEAPSGLALAEAVAVDEGGLDPEDPWGTAALGCGDGSRFEPSWLLLGWCARADVVGVPLVVEVTP